MSSSNTAPAAPQEQPLGPYHTLPHTYIGIDGGGTSTKGICLSFSSNDGESSSVGNVAAQRVSFQKIKHCHLNQSSNPNSVGIENATTTLCNMIKSLRNGRVIAIGLALAGTSSFHFPSLETRILEIFADVEEKYRPRVFLESDAYGALCSAFVAEGMVLIAGTGVNCSGYQYVQQQQQEKERQLIRSAAWGPLLGDSGSGFWIGQQALTRLCQWTDRITPQQQQLKIGINTDVNAEVKQLNQPYEELRDAIFQFLDLNSMDALVKWVYSDPSWSRIASLTQIVVQQVLEKDNSVCRDIIDDAAFRLAEYVKNVERQMQRKEENEGSPVKVVLVGSVIARRDDSPVRDALVKHLKDTNVEVCLPDHSAEEGAAWMAMYLSGEEKTS